MKMLKPEEYQKKTNKIFKKIHKEIKYLIPSSRIEHIGASAIKGAISKGDIDIFVGVASNKFEDAVGLLGRSGYFLKQGTLRDSSLCMLVTNKYNYDVAIQLVENGSEFEMFLTFRDKLRSDYRLLQEYNRLKIKCINLNENSYREKKSKFIENVLKP